MGEEEKSRQGKPESATTPEEVAFCTQEAWREAELKRITGSWAPCLQNQVNKTGDAGVGLYPGRSNGAGGVNHQPLSGLDVRPSILGADLAALLIAGAVIVLIVVGFLFYVPSSRRSELKGNPETMVWVNRKTGLYFCAGTNLYGKGVGTYMRQGTAQRQSIRPALYGECE